MALHLSTASWCSPRRRARSPTPSSRTCPSSSSAWSPSRILFLFLRAKVFPVFERVFAERTAAIEGGMEQAEARPRGGRGAARAVPRAARRGPHRGRSHPHRGAGAARADRRGGPRRGADRGGAHRRAGAVADRQRAPAGRRRAAARGGRPGRAARGPHRRGVARGRGAPAPHRRALPRGPRGRSCHQPGRPSDAGSQPRGAPGRARALRGADRQPARRRRVGRGQRGPVRRRRPARPRALAAPRADRPGVLPGRRGAAWSTRLLGQQLSALPLEVLRDLVAERWRARPTCARPSSGSPRRRRCRAAEGEGVLDDVEDELFRFSRLLEREPALRAALTDPGLPADRKSGLVQELLGGRAKPATTRLVELAVTRLRGQSLESALEDLVELAASAPLALRRAGPGRPAARRRPGAAAGRGAEPHVRPRGPAAGRRRPRGPRRHRGARRRRGHRRHRPAPPERRPPLARGLLDPPPDAPPKTTKRAGNRR